MMSLKKIKAPAQVILSIITCVLLILVQDGHAQGSAAGKVVFVMGTPQAVNAAGTARNLARGDEIYSGDRLITGRGRLQVSMADGAFISVQPNTEYILDNYNYSGQPDGTEQAVYRLAKGGVRAVTGLIGRTNTEAYKVNTAVATIGIRGTGHNTRLCTGDCGSGVKDGLYHNTWEGITYVVNDVDSEDVPAGDGVYVEDIDTEILPLDQASAVTAVRTDTEEIEEEEEETRDAEDRSTVIATGDQRNPEGDQTAVLGDGILRPTSSEVISGLVAGGVHPDDESMDGIGDFGMTDATVFVDPDGKIIGIIGFEQEDMTPGLGFGTINLNAALGAGEPVLVAEIKALLGLLDDASLRLFLANPAEAVESTIIGDIGFTRWANGLFIGVGENDVNESDFIHELTGFQSLHFIFGPEPGPITFNSIATYNFLDGTDSTSATGASKGLGVTGGSIMVDFFQSSASLNMTVNHVNTANTSGIYNVSGPLSVDTIDAGIDDMGTVIATGGTGACGGMTGCGVFINGGFAGPDATPGLPSHIGIKYVIQETDKIIGVAGFEY